MLRGEAALVCIDATASWTSRSKVHRAYPRAMARSNTALRTVPKRASLQWRKSDPYERRIPASPTTHHASKRPGSKAVDSRSSAQTSQSTPSKREMGRVMAGRAAGLTDLANPER